MAVTMAGVTSDVMTDRRPRVGAGHASGPGGCASPAAAPGRVLRLHVMGEYFRAIRDRSKPLEFRLDTPYWRQRLVGRTYDAVEIAHGYPKADDSTRRVRRAWRGVAPQTLTHPHFGDAPVAVLAIDVTGADLPLDGVDAPEVTDIPNVPDVPDARDGAAAPDAPAPATSVAAQPVAGPTVKSPAANGVSHGAAPVASHDSPACS